MINLINQYGREITFTVIGALLSWAISYFYFYRGVIEQAQAFNKLSLEMRAAIIDSSSSQITKDDLGEILHELSNAPVDASRLRGTISGGTF